MYIVSFIVILHILSPPQELPDFDKLPIDLHNVHFDLRQHQSWTAPTGNGHQLLNLYQRQCLTVDRDAPTGKETEVYRVPISSSGSGSDSSRGSDEGIMGVLIWNKAKLSRKIEVTWDMIGLPEGQRYHVRDLWTHEDWPILVKDSLSKRVDRHGVLMLKMTPVK